MTQVNPSSYVKPYFDESRSDGWYIERSTNDLVACINGTIVGRFSSSGGAAALALARGSIFAGDSSGLAAALSAKTSGNILVGDGTDLKSVAVSGDVTLTSAGVTAIGAGKVVSAMLAESLLRYIEVTIASADITSTAEGKFGHANGYPIVAAPGDGKVVEFVSGLITYDYLTAAYTDGGNVGFAYTGWGAVSGVVSAANSVGGSGDKNALVLPAVPTNNQALNNVGLSLVTSAAFTQPGTAAGVVRVKCCYRVYSTGL